MPVRASNFREWEKSGLALDTLPKPPLHDLAVAARQPSSDQWEDGIASLCDPHVDLVDQMSPNDAVDGSSSARKCRGERCRRLALFGSAPAFLFGCLGTSAHQQSCMVRYRGFRAWGS